MEKAIFVTEHDLKELNDLLKQGWKVKFMCARNVATGKEFGFRNGDILVIVEMMGE